MYVDKHANMRHREPELVRQSFYGQLKHIFVVPIQPATTLGLSSQQTLILAGIYRCQIDSTNSRGMLYYSKMGRYEVVDITTIQCLIGRVSPRESQWAIIDRTVNLNWSYYLPDE